MSCLIAVLLASQVADGQETSSLGDSLLFHASFDGTGDADFARGDARIYTAATLRREDVKTGLHSDAVALVGDQGRYGGGLEFTKKTDQIIFFQGPGNLPKTQAGFSGTYSFWMCLDPAEDLPPGYVDPIQITDKKWNDASFFVDFTQENPRDFRLGVFSDFSFWNPDDRQWEDVPEDERPLVTVKKLPFSRDRWVHVGITFTDFNRDDKQGVAILYLDGESQGEIRGKQQITWGEDKLAIMLGIYYVGLLDDFAIFDRALSAAEMKALYELPEGVGSIRAK